MKKRVFPFVLVLILSFMLTVPALAENRNGVYILDEKAYLSESEYQFYQTHAMELSDELDMDILYVQTYDTDLQKDAQGLNLGKRTNQIMLLDNDGTCDVALFGKAQVLSEDHIQQLMNAYTVEPTYSEGVASYLETAAQLVMDLNDSGAFNEWSQMNHVVSRVVDRADLLNIPEEEALLQKLDEISQRQQLDVVVVTVDSLEGKSALAYADDFFDYNGYGIGEDRDGILLLISMEDRDWAISTSGYGIDAFTDAGQERLTEYFVPKLSDGEYADAFMTFAEQCDVYITQARSGDPYDVGNLPKGSFAIGKCLFISLLIGAIAAACVVWYMERQLKSVRAQDGAAAYTLSSRPNLTVNQEIYLYSTMSKRPKPKPSSSSSGGSTIHRGSSGRSHGGSSGKF